MSQVESAWKGAMSRIWILEEPEVTVGWTDSVHPIFDALAVERGGPAINAYCLARVWPQRWITGISEADA